MRVTFEKDWSWRVPERNGLVSIRYRAGKTYSVRRICGEEAIARGVARAAVRPRSEQVSDGEANA